MSGTSNKRTSISSQFLKSKGAVNGQHDYGDLNVLCDVTFISTNYVQNEAETPSQIGNNLGGFEASNDGRKQLPEQSLQKTSSLSSFDKPKKVELRRSSSSGSSTRALQPRNDFGYRVRSHNYDEESAELKASTALLTNDTIGHQNFRYPVANFAKELLGSNGDSVKKTEPSKDDLLVPIPPPTFTNYPNEQSFSSEYIQSFPGEESNSSVERFQHHSKSAFPVHLGMATLGNVSRREVNVYTDSNPTSNSVGYPSEGSRKESPSHDNGKTDSGTWGHTANNSQENLNPDPEQQQFINQLPNEDSETDGYTSECQNVDSETDGYASEGLNQEDSETDGYTSEFLNSETDGGTSEYFNPDSETETSEYHDNQDSSTTNQKTQSLNEDSGEPPSTPETCRKLRFGSRTKREAKKTSNCEKIKDKVKRRRRTSGQNGELELERTPDMRPKEASMKEKGGNFFRKQLMSLKKEILTKNYEIKELKLKLKQEREKIKELFQQIHKGQKVITLLLLLLLKS